MVDDITAILDETGTNKAVLIGLSQSGATVCQYAADHPDRVQAIVTIGTTSPLAPAIERDVSDVLGADERPIGWAKDTPDYYRVDHEDFVRFFLNEVNSEPHSTKQLEDCVEWALDGDGHSLAMTLEAEPLINLNEETYRNVSCPSLIIHAENDEICHVGGSRRVAKLTGGELVVMERGGHAPQGRFPAQVNTLIRDFLARKLATHKPRRKPRMGPGQTHEGQNRNNFLHIIIVPTCCFASSFDGPFWVLSAFTRLMAILRMTARFAAALRSRRRLSSSLKPTSSTQCRLFSIAQ